MWLCISGSGAEAQHHPADVWRKGWRGRRAETGPWGCEEHVQNPDRRTAAEPEIGGFYCALLLLGHSQWNESTIIATHAFTVRKDRAESLSSIPWSKEIGFLYLLFCFN